MSIDECQCFDRSKAIKMPEGIAFSSSTLRALAADHRLCLMPAKFRWALEWAAEEIERLRGTNA